MAVQVEGKDVFDIQQQIKQTDSSWIKITREYNYSRDMGPAEKFRVSVLVNTDEHYMQLVDIKGLRAILKLELNKQQAVINRYSAEQKNMNRQAFAAEARALRKVIADAKKKLAALK